MVNMANIIAAKHQNVSSTSVVRIKYKASELLTWLYTLSNSVSVLSLYCLGYFSLARLKYPRLTAVLGTDR